MAAACVAEWDRVMHSVRLLRCRALMSCGRIDDKRAKGGRCELYICRGLSGVVVEFGFGCVELILALIFRGQHALPPAASGIRESVHCNTDTDY